MVSSAFHQIPNNFSNYNVLYAVVFENKYTKSRTFNDKNRWFIKKVIVLKKLLPHLASRGTYSPGEWKCDEAGREQTWVYPPVMCQQRLSFCTWELNVMDQDNCGGGGGGVIKEGERKEGDFLMLWCSFSLWTRPRWIPFPLPFEAAAWPSVWPCSLVQTWSGMRLLFDRWSHDNQPRWASLDKPILCLHISCVDSRTGVSSSWKLLPCSPPKVQSAPQWWRAWLCRTISQYLVVPGYGRCDVGVKSFFRSAAIFQILAAARNICPCGLLACRVGASPSWWKLMYGLGLGWAARWRPYTEFWLTQLVWRTLGYGAMCTSEVNSHRMKEHAAGSLLQTCTSRRCHLLWSPTACD